MLVSKASEISVVITNKDPSSAAPSQFNRDNSKDYKEIKKEYKAIRIEKVPGVFNSNEILEDSIYNQFSSQDSQILAKAGAQKLIST